MILITSLEDERLDIKKNPTYVANIVGVRNAIDDVMVLRDSLRAVISERDALQAQLCAARESYHSLRMSATGMSSQVIISHHAVQTRLLERMGEVLGWPEYKDPSPCRHAEDSKRLNQSMDTIHAVSENRRKMFEDAHNALTRMNEKLDRERLAKVLAPVVALTLLRPFRAALRWEKALLDADAIIAYLKEEK